MDRRKEAVDHPAHYNQGQFEPIDVIEDWQLGFHLGNTVKYIARAKHKGRELEDLEKAKWYLQRYIDGLIWLQTSNEAIVAQERLEKDAKLSEILNEHGAYAVALEEARDNNAVGDGLDVPVEGVGMEEFLEYPPTPWENKEKVEVKQAEGPVTEAEYFDSVAAPE